MSWLYISLVAYLLLAVANLGDKLVVSKYLSSPRIYAISVALLQVYAILLLPFFGEWPGWQNLLLDFAAGAILVVAIYYLYSALKAGEASRIVPTIDAFIPIAVLALSFLFLSESFSQQQFTAIIFLIAGGFLLAYERQAKNKLVLKYIAIAIITFGIAQIVAKVTYSNQPFLSAFIWARIGGIVAVVPLLFIATIRKELKSNFSKKNKNSNSKAVLFTQIAGGVGFFLQSYAIKLGKVSIVAALQGIKHLFLFLLIILFSKKFVQLREDWSRLVLMQKVVGIVLVGVGLVLLVL
jgi:uncharacterized membrane protein